MKKRARDGRSARRKETAKRQKSTASKAESPKPEAQSPKPEAPAEAGQPPASSAPRPPDWRIVNRVQLAELMGVHPDTVTDNTKMGMPVVNAGGRGRESEYDSVACLAWWRERVGRNALEKAKTRAADLSADKTEMELEQRRGKLVSREEVILAGQTFVKAWTAKLRTIPTRLRHLGVIHHEQESGVAALVRDILNDVSTWKTVADAMDSATKDSAA